MDQSAPNQSRHVVDSSAWKSCCGLTRWWKPRYAAGGPHVAFGSFWACQTSQQPHSQWQQTPSLFLPPNINLPLYPPSELRAVFQKQSPKQKKPPMTTQQKSQLSFCGISFHVGNVPDLFTTTRDCYLFLFNTMTKQQIYICKSRCCNRFDYSWPKACKRGLSATAVSKVLVLCWAVKTPPSVEACAQNDNMN